MWSKLKSVYDKESVVSVHLLQQKFFLIEFKEDSVAIFMSKLEEIRVKLKQAREPISDKILITKVIMSQPEQFKQFRSAWEFVPLELQSVQELISRLLTQQERIGSRDEEVLVLDSVSNRSSRKCYTCGKDGHLARFCDKNKRQELATIARREVN
ncbi:hypothetical protein PR048_010913 [Dryococelus australis]|uniref:CCHC-type domain-containing protein n=1 Tax=Dryococelus australis TaxID=614101 RepID=A0ABQ9I4G9_9NEOP|nr:hypothetical protein PR048_010913 [Dryococelus australis]